MGSPCDTISGITDVLRADKEKILKVFPNPASDVVTIDYGFTDWNRGNVDLEITNDLGQIIYTQALPAYSGYQRLDVSQWSAGLYQAFIKRKGVVVAREKFVRQ